MRRSYRVSQGVRDLGPGESGPARDAPTTGPARPGAARAGPLLLDGSEIAAAPPSAHLSQMEIGQLVPAKPSH